MDEARKGRATGKGKGRAVYNSAGKTGPPASRSIGWGLPVTIQEALDEIHLGQAEALAAFKGDAAPFKAVRGTPEEYL